MEIFTPEFRVENSVDRAITKYQVEDKIVPVLKELSECENEVSGYISGQPYHIWGNSYDGEHFSDCAFQVGRLVRLERVWWQLTGDKSWSFPEGFVNNQGYPALYCADKNGIYYQMGMHSMFGFELELIEN
jgi:hypothetical protein